MALEHQHKRYQRERRILQVFVGGVALFPLLLGGAVAATGSAGVFLLFGLEGPAPTDPTLDSGIRFLASNFFGMGLVVLWVLPKVESRVTAFRIFTATAVLGASARILSHVTVGRPNLLTEALIGVELSIVLLALWQTRVHRLHRELESLDAP